MLRVFGVTYDHTTNYGSCLQAYALQKTIEGICIDDSNCNYKLIPVRKLTLQQSGRKSISGILYDKLYTVLHRKPFKIFEDTYMNMAECKSLSELDMLNLEADAFVCGSDVIWNPEYNSNIGAYYLNFAKKYSFAYAPSFGKANESVIDSRIQGYIRKLDSISCREENGVEIVKKITGKAPPVVVDPVFLVKGEQWNELGSIKAKVPDHYILSYNTYISDEYESFLKRLSNATGYPIIRTTWKQKNAIRQKMLTVHSPQEWLKLMKGADYVVTNSFHGTAFAIIFHKTFFTVVRGDSSNGFNVRMYNLLENMGLGDRIYNKAPQEIDLSDIDYSTADVELERLRSLSLDFLRKNLEEAYNEKLELQ